MQSTSAVAKLRLKSVAHLGIFNWAEEMGAPHHLDLEAWPQLIVTRATQQERMIRVHVIEKALVRCVLQSARARSPASPRSGRAP